MYAGQFWPNGALVASVVGAGIGVAVASLAVAGLLGLIFGVPRVHEPAASATQGHYLPNTNLEELSDWLAKVLVGVGLRRPDRRAPVERRREISP